MDSRKGFMERFENDLQLNERIAEIEMLKENVGSIFRVGEIVKIKDSRFKIRAIGKREMRLRLMMPE